MLSVVRKLVALEGNASFHKFVYQEIFRIHVLLVEIDRKEVFLVPRFGVHVLFLK